MAMLTREIDVENQFDVTSISTGAITATTAGRTLIALFNVAFSDDRNGILTVTDTASNPWTRIRLEQTPGGSPSPCDVEAWYVPAASCKATTNVTATLEQGFVGMKVMEWAGLLPSSTVVGSNGEHAQATSAGSNTITPSRQALLIAVMCAEINLTTNLSSPSWTALDQFDGGRTSLAAYKIVAPQDGSQEATWTMVSNFWYSGMVAAFAVADSTGTFVGQHVGRGSAW